MNPKNTLKATGAIILFTLNFAPAAQAGTINILCTQAEYEMPGSTCGSYMGTTTDGTIFQANADPSEPATGTGVFKPFVRVQENGNGSDGVTGTQNGYNTDVGEPDINFDTKAGLWTHSVLFGDLGTIEIGGLSYYQFQLDANESGKADSDQNKLDITDIQIYVGNDTNMATPESGSGYTGTAFNNPYDGTLGGTNSLLGLAPVWTLDSLLNEDVTVTLQASICDAGGPKGTGGQCGSGHGDMNLFILESMFTGADTDYFVFYTEYGNADFGVDSGFEEWNYLAKTASVPEPSSIVLMGLGLLGMSAATRRRKHV